MTYRGLITFMLAAVLCCVWGFYRVVVYGDVLPKIDTNRKVRCYFIWLNGSRREVDCP